MLGARTRVRSSSEGEKGGRKKGLERCVRVHEDPGSRGPSRFDPPTPARIRHTRTPMLRGPA